MLTEVTDPALPIVIPSLITFPKTSVPVIVAVRPESLPAEFKVMQEADWNPPTAVIPETFALTASLTNVTSVVPAPLEPVIASLFASVVTANCAYVNGNDILFLTQAASLTFVPIVVPVFTCIGPVVIGPEKFVFAIIILQV